MKIIFRITICFSALLFLSALGAQAASIGVKPEKVSLTMPAGRSVSAEILVLNTGFEPMVYRVSLDGLTDDITVLPREFKLDAGSSQLLNLSAKKWLSGEYSTDLSIVTRSLDISDFTTAAGVKLPIILIVTGLPLIQALLIIGLALACLFGYFLLKLNKIRL